LRLRAIVTRDRNDALHLSFFTALWFYSRWFSGSVVADPDNNALIINGTTVHIISPVLLRMIIPYTI
jgi:glyceraldehyde 3-phosphate dehydrogenase